MIKEISKSKLFKAKEIHVGSKPTSSGTAEGTLDDPVKLLAMGLEMDIDKFRELELIGIKNENIQILKPNKLTPSENGLLILAASEFGLHRKSLPYEEWKELCEASNIKSKTTFGKIANNAKNYKHIDKKKYETEQVMVLTSIGINVLKKALDKMT